MSLANNKTGDLWGSFMPRRKEIKNIGTGAFRQLTLAEPSTSNIGRHYLHHKKISELISYLPLYDECNLQVTYSSYWLRI